MLGATTAPGSCVQIYLPIAELPVSIFLVLGMGLAVGFISGMFGIGGGFLMTPLLIFIGVPPAVSVASVTSHIAASSFSGAISYWRKRAIDIALALMLLGGGFVGTAVGVWLFTKLRTLDQLDLVIGLAYVTVCRRRSGGPAVTPGFMDCRSRSVSSARRFTFRRYRCGRSAS
jgi:uncharacterized membrane protein YfcA